MVCHNETQLFNLDPDKGRKKKVTLMLPNRFVRSVLTPLEGIRCMFINCSRHGSGSQQLKQNPGGNVDLVLVFTPKDVFHCNNAAKVP